MEKRLTTLIAALLDEDKAPAELEALSDEQLAATDAELLDVYKAIRAGEVEGVEPDDLDELQKLKGARDALSAEVARREAVAAAALADAEKRAEDAAALDAEMIPAVAETPTEPETPDGDEDDPETPAEPEAIIEPEKVPVSAAVKRPTIAELAAAPRPAEAAPRAPAPARTEARWKLAGGGQADLNDRIELAKRVIEAKDSLVNAPAGFRDKVTVASFSIARPDELEVHVGADASENQRKIDALVAPALSPTPEMKALTASGGWCAPAEPRYQIPSVTTAARPFRDGLPRMGSQRGTISFVRAARLSTILANQAGAAVTTWEEDTDAVPGESTKTRQTHACRTLQTEEVGAVVARMRFGNFQQRAFPEDVAHDLELVAARHARVAERRLVDALIGDMNIDVSYTGLFGTARDARFSIQQAASEIRYTERMGRERAMRGAIDGTILDMVQADVVHQQASGETDALLVDDAFARRLLALTTVGLIYMLETPTGADEFVTNADTQNLADYPDNFEIPIFPDGSAVFVDSGELNLGIVRDSTLNNTNDYEVFYETFEGLLWLGPYGKTVTLTTCPTGESQIAVAETGICSGS